MPRLAIQEHHPRADHLDFRVEGSGVLAVASAAALVRRGFHTGVVSPRAHPARRIFSPLLDV